MLCVEESGERKLTMEGSVWTEHNESVLRNDYPLHLCCRDGDVETAAYLLSCDRSATQIEDCFFGWTPLHWASCYGKLECLQKLASYLPIGTSIDIKSARYSQTSLHVAALSGHSHCLLWLLQAGADANNQDYLGETALHKSIRSGSIECAVILLLKNANIRLNNVNDQSPGELAVACGQSILTVLLQKINECITTRNLRDAQSILHAVMRNVAGEFHLPSSIFPHFKLTNSGLNFVISEENISQYQNNIHHGNDGKRKRPLTECESEACKRTKFDGSDFDSNTSLIYNNGTFALPSDGPVIPYLMQHESSFGIQTRHDISRHIPRCLGHYI